MRHFLSNLVCGFIIKKSTRDRIRTRIRFPQTREYIKFVRNFAKNMKRCNIKTTVGYGCHNFIVILNKKFVFKFPLLTDGKDIAVREKRITDAFSKISPIKIPAMKILYFRDIAVRKYEFANGVLMTDIPPRVFNKHSYHVAKQLAEFIYTIGVSDPAEIRDLKPRPDAKPDFMYGWFQDDIWQNFMVNPKTFDITFFIDWEGTKFENFYGSLAVSSHNWDKFGYQGLIVEVMAEYAKLYIQRQGK